MLRGVLGRHQDETMGISECVSRIISRRQTLLPEIGRRLADTKLLQRRVQRLIAEESGLNEAGCGSQLQALRDLMIALDEAVG